MTEWGKLKHHDPKQMIAICGSDHDLCTRGIIDYSAQLSYKERLLNSQEAEETTLRSKGRHQSDLKVLLRLFSYICRPRIVNYLAEAQYNRIDIDMGDEVDWSARTVYTPLFHLYDKELTKLILEFYASWYRADRLAIRIHHDYGHNGHATLISYVGDESSIHAKNHEFQTEVVATIENLRRLNLYLREHFPELDLEKTDNKAWRAFRKAYIAAKEAFPPKSKTPTTNKRPTAKKGKAAE